MNVHHTDGVVELVASLACARRALTIARDGEVRFRGVPHTAFDYSEILPQMTVQGWIADDSANQGYQPITCSACGQVHYGIPKTAKVLGYERRE